MSKKIYGVPVTSNGISGESEVYRNIKFKDGL